MGWFMQSFLFLLFFLLAQSLDLSELLKPGNCKGLWRRDKLLGKCFGIGVHSKFPELSGLDVVHTAEECRSLCCNLGDKCVTWQYQSGTKICKLGGPVRLGFEGSDTANWCDPHPPSLWNGREILRRENGKCVWGKSLPNQCFGLGPERLNPTSSKPLDADECEAACCLSPTCDMWQQANGRGCYFSSSQGVGCDASKESPYSGGRKCIPHFCGSLEEESEILKAFNVSHHN